MIKAKMLEQKAKELINAEKHLLTTNVWERFNREIHSAELKTPVYSA